MHSTTRHAISFAIACAGALANASLVSPATAGTNRWTPIGPGAARFAVDPSSPFTIYLVGDNSVAKTTDGGAHWTDVAKSEFVIYSLAIDPASPATIYAAAEKPGISMIRPSTRALTEGRIGRRFPRIPTAGTSACWRLRHR